MLDTVDTYAVDIAKPNSGLADDAETIGDLRVWRIELYVHTEPGCTSAQALLHGEACVGVKTVGRSYHRVGAPDFPEIGHGLAVARALRRMSDHLLRTAQDDLLMITGMPSRLTG